MHITDNDTGCWIYLPSCGCGDEKSCNVTMKFSIYASNSMTSELLATHFHRAKKLATIQKGRFSLMDSQINNSKLNHLGQRIIFKKKIKQPSKPDSSLN